MIACECTLEGKGHLALRFLHPEKSTRIVAPEHLPRAGVAFREVAAHHLQAMAYSRLIAGAGSEIGRRQHLDILGREGGAEQLGCEAIERSAVGLDLCEFLQ